VLNQELKMVVYTVSNVCKSTKAVSRIPRKEDPMKTKLGAIVLLTLLLAMSALGQAPSRPIDAKTKDALKELFNELRTWAQGNVIPKMREWKGRLDNAMSPEDLQTLNALRDQATRLKNAGRKLAADVRAARRAKDVRELKALRAKGKLLKEKRNEILKDLKPIALKYKSTLQELGKESKPLGKEWRGESRTMVKEWYEAHKSDFGPGFRRIFANAVQRLRKLNGPDENLKAKIAAARFMLWDGKDLPPVGEMMDDPDSESKEVNASVPDGYSLDPNYPNPFNPSTTISFTIARPEHVSLTVYDALGREVAKIVDADLGAGTHTASFDGRSLASGLYVYRIQAGSFLAEKKMQLLK
jgi:gas vesicle protein